MTLTNLDDSGSAPVRQAFHGYLTNVQPAITKTASVLNLLNSLLRLP